MRFWVGVTDDDWFRFLAGKKPDEVNFWRPGASQTAWGPVPPGAPFLFKLHSPNDYVVGGGYFVKHTTLPLSLAWLAYEEKNGTESQSKLREAIIHYRREAVKEPDPVIGCTLLAEPFFLERQDWVRVPKAWPKNIVQGKTLDSEDGDMGSEIWEGVFVRVGRENPRTSEAPRYGSPQLHTPRLGQGTFRVLVTDAYRRRCAMTGEKTLPVLEAAHIKPYAENGPHQINNGLLLRSDIHILFDRGYIGVDQDLKVRVSGKLREQYQNGKVYYMLEGERLRALPDHAMDQPAREYLEWHQKTRFLA